jgi:DNA repair protein SbcC/Rad50
MIPITLQLKNFLSYGPQLQTIEFGNHPLICLSGKNGHGKSALLDAITWAIWGKARKVLAASKADEGLLRLGQTHMQVMLDFTFNGRSYRVRREFTLAQNKATAHLEFGIIDQDTKQVIPLTDKTIRATQEKIETTIGLDYEAFVNTAFLRQGNSNEFSQKSPKERKEILAAILGLAHYEELRKRAMDKAKRAADEQIVLSAKHAQLTETIQINTHLTHTQHEVEQQLKQLEIASKALHATNATIAQARVVYAQLQSKHEHITHAQIKIRELRTLWKKVHIQQLTMPDITIVDRERTATAQRHQELLAQQAKLFVEKEQLLISREQEQRYKTELHSTYAELQKKVGTLTELQEQRKKIATQLQHAEQAIATHEVTLKALAPLEQQFERRKTYYQRYIALGNFLSTQKDGLIHKQSLNETDDPSCPLCEQNLSAARKRFLTTKFDQEAHFLSYRLARLTTVIGTLKAKLTAQHEQRQALLATAQQKELLAHKVQELRTQQEQITVQILELVAHVPPTLAPFEQWLTTQPEYLARANTNNQV